MSPTTTQTEEDDGLPTAAPSPPSPPPQPQPPHPDTAAAAATTTTTPNKRSTDPQRRQETATSVPPGSSGPPPTSTTNATGTASSTADDTKSTARRQSLRLRLRLRQLIRLVQCPRCSRPLRDPRTLPCGRSVCRACLPPPRPRRHVSYPGTPDRRLGVRCPLACGSGGGGGGGEHALADCDGVDVVLADVVASVEAVLGREEEGEGEGEGENGILRAAYALARRGELGYDAELESAAVALGGGDEGDEGDARLLARVRDAARPELDCRVCYALLLEPVTTGCGHTFCRACLQRALDDARYCPACRRALSMQPAVYPAACPANAALSGLTAYFWPDVLEERRREEQATAALGNDYDDYDNNNHYYDDDDDHDDRDRSRPLDTPVFVGRVVLPGMVGFLHIFEPRYRLMIRRVLERRDRVFGMVDGDDYDGGGGGAPLLGTLVRIVNYDVFPDGRFLLQTVGTARFRVVEHGEHDGYVVARVRRIRDIGVAQEEEREAAEVGLDDGGAGDADPERGTPTSELLDRCVAFVERVRARNADWQTARVLARHGPCPRDAAVFPWWLASVFAVEPAVRRRLLAATSVRERMKVCRRWVAEWEADGWW